MEGYPKDTMVVPFDVRSSFLCYIHVSHFWLSIDNRIVFLCVHSLCRLSQHSIRWTVFDYFQGDRLCSSVMFINEMFVYRCVRFSLNYVIEMFVKTFCNTSACFTSIRFIFFSMMGSFTFDFICNFSHSTFDIRHSTFLSSHYIIEKVNVGWRKYYEIKLLSSCACLKWCYLHSN